MDPIPVRLFFDPFQSGPNGLSPFQDNFSQAKTKLLHAFQAIPVRPNLIPPFQVISVRPKTTSSISSHSSQAKIDIDPPFPNLYRQAKTNFSHSKPFRFQSDQSDFFHSKPFQLGQNLLPGQYCQ
jgi:hypothetical protein